jgi:hypothetical protein
MGGWLKSQRKNIYIYNIFYKDIYTYIYKVKSIKSASNNSIPEATEATGTEDAK